MISGLRIKDLSHWFIDDTGDPLHVLDNISFDAPQGQIVSLLGPSGCGKTTVLQIAADLIPDVPVRTSSTAITLDANNPLEARSAHKIGFVFQRPVFFRWMSIYSQISLQRSLAKKPPDEQLVREILRNFELWEFRDYFPHQISGGMLARAALARALVSEPTHLFLDEAFNSLDEMLRLQLNLSVHQYARRAKITVVMVTHNSEEALLMSDKIIVLSPRPAKIIKSIDVDLPVDRSIDTLSNSRFISLRSNIRKELMKYV